VSIADGLPRAHDPELLDRLASVEQRSFSGEVWRATRLNQEPTAFSYNGGRWAPPSSYQSVPVLYTSLAREGAVAEMTSWLDLLVPRPTKPILLHRMEVVAQTIVTLDHRALGGLGITTENYGSRSYVAMGEAPPSRSQEIGAALSFLEIDGLIVPSARHNCDNLILFDNANNRVEISVLGSEEFDWIGRQTP
jgi:RES domain